MIALFNIRLIILRYQGHIKRSEPNFEEKYLENENKEKIESKYNPNHKICSFHIIIYFLASRENNEAISIFSLVRRIREQRWGMVHNNVT